MDSFVQLSALLTGIDPAILVPPLNPEANKIKQQYFNQAMQSDGVNFTLLLSIYAANSTQPPATIADIILNQSGAPICYLARSIMLMWYLGSWYSPTALQNYTPSNPTPPANTVVSPTAYTQGWAWSVAQAHAMGFSQLNFGYWNGQPPSLNSIVKGVSA
jgi:hypothetical protein